MDDGFVRVAGKTFRVTAYQVAAAFHDPCPLRTCSTPTRPWEHCPRASGILDRTRSLLERAVEKPLVPGVPTKTRPYEDDEPRQALPPGYEQVRMLDL